MRLFLQLHDKEPFDSAGFDGIDNFVCQSDNLIVGEAAYDTSGFNFIGCGKGLGKSDDFRKVLFPIFICFNMLAAREAGGAGGVYPVSDLFAPWRDNAVGCEQNRAVEGLKLGELLPPWILWNLQ